MARYIDTVAILFVVYAIFQIAIACMVGGIYGLLGGGVMAVGVVESEPEAMIGGGLFVALSIFIVVIMAIQPVLALIAASGLRRRTQLGRILGIIVCALAVLNMPLGTIVAIFGFIVLIDKEASAEFSAEGKAEYFS